MTRTVAFRVGRSRPSANSVPEKWLPVTARWRQDPAYRTSHVTLTSLSRSNARSLNAIGLSLRSLGHAGARAGTRTPDLDGFRNLAYSRYSAAPAVFEPFHRTASITSFRSRTICRQSHRTLMEFVYVVPREQLFPEFYPQGLQPFGEDLSEENFDRAVVENGFFVERDYAERTPTLQQVIPYSIVVCNGQVLLLKRLDRGGEARLHGKLSIGVGGHINPVDLADERGEIPKTRTSELLTAGSQRELEEELWIKGSVSVRRYGVINDDSNAVGAVHVGVLQIVSVEGSATVRELDQLEGVWKTPDELQQLAEGSANIETWSRIALASLPEILPEPITA